MAVFRIEKARGYTVMYCRMLDAMLSKGQEDENGILFVCSPVTAIVTVGMSQSNRCCDTVKAERVAATNGGRRQLVHKMFTNAQPQGMVENLYVFAGA